MTLLDPTVHAMRGVNAYKYLALGRGGTLSGATPGNSVFRCHIECNRSPLKKTHR